MFIYSQSGKIRAQLEPNYLHTDLLPSFLFRGISLMYHQISPYHWIILNVKISFFLIMHLLFLAVLGLRCGAGFSLVVASGGYSLVVVCRLLTAAASLPVEHGLQVCGLQQLWLPGSRAQAQYLWSMGLVAAQHVGSSWTKGIKPVSPALAGGFFTTEPPGKPSFSLKKHTHTHTKLIYLFVCTKSQLQHVGSSFLTKDHEPRPPELGAWSLSRQTTKEVLDHSDQHSKK